MQCKECGDNDFETGYEEDCQPDIRMTFVETQFRCLTCGALHSLKFNWADFDCESRPSKEILHKGILIPIN